MQSGLSIVFTHSYRVQWHSVWYYYLKTPFIHKNHVASFLIPLGTLNPHYTKIHAHFIQNFTHKQLSTFKFTHAYIKNQFKHPKYRINHNRPRTGQV